VAETSTEEEERLAFARDVFCAAGTFIEPSFADPNVPQVFTPDDLPAVFAERLLRHERAQPGYAQMWAELNKRLTTIGGQGVWTEEYVNDALPHLLATGELVPEGVVIVQGPGRPNECHASVLALCDSGQLRHLWRGYALAESGFWFGHTWGINARGQLVETTTVKWSSYYGAPWKYRDESSLARERRATAKRERRAERNRRLSVKGN